MTRKEATKTLTELRRLPLLLTEKEAEAVDMAIEALGREQQLLDAGYHNATVDFYIGGRLFRAKEIAQ